MSLIDGLKKLAPPMMVLFVVSKIILGVGIGMLISGYFLPGFGWWVFWGGVILSVIPAVKVLAGR